MAPTKSKIFDRCECGVLVFVSNLYREAMIPTKFQNQNRVWTHLKLSLFNGFFYSYGDFHGFCGGAAFNGRISLLKHNRRAPGLPNGVFRPVLTSILSKSHFMVLRYRIFHASRFWGPLNHHKIRIHPPNGSIPTVWDRTTAAGHLGMSTTTLEAQLRVISSV